MTAKEFIKGIFNLFIGALIALITFIPILILKKSGHLTEVDICRFLDKYFPLP